MVSLQLEVPVSQQSAAVRPIGRFDSFSAEELASLREVLCMYCVSILTDAAAGTITPDERAVAASSLSILGRLEAEVCDALGIARPADEDLARLVDGIRDGLLDPATEEAA